MDEFTLLQREFPTLVLERNFSFARHTTIGCGGIAALSASPATPEEACKLLRFLVSHEIPHCFLGAGANTLPADGTYAGVVVRFTRLAELAVRDERIVAGAGVTGGRLLRFAEGASRGGLEFLTGIPMTVGGAVVMNAGVRAGHIGDLVERVVAVVDGEIAEIPQADCGFGEKKSIFQQGVAVLGATLYAPRKPREDIAEAREKFRAARRDLPSGRSMGCVFVNPEGYSAGALIDACGLKGTRRGGAVVSDRHANFILNEGATSAEIESLIEYVKKTVYARTGVRLREEIRRIP